MKYNTDGSFAVTLVGQNDLPVGLYAPDGSTRVTQDAGFGLYAPNGSLRIGSSGFSAYTPSGAMNGTLSGSSFRPVGNTTPVLYRIAPVDANNAYLITPSPWGTALAYRFSRNLGGSDPGDIGPPWAPWRRTGVVELSSINDNPASPIFTLTLEANPGAVDYTMQRSGGSTLNGASYHGGESVVTETILLDGQAIDLLSAKTGKTSLSVAHTSTITWPDASTASVTYSQSISPNGVLTENGTMTSTANAATETYFGMEIGQQLFSQVIVAGVPTDMALTPASTTDYPQGTAKVVKLRSPTTGHTIECDCNSPDMPGYSSTFVRRGAASTNYRSKIYYRKGSTSGVALGTRNWARTTTFGKGSTG